MKTMVDMGLVDHTIAGGIISFQPPGIVNVLAKDNNNQTKK